MRAPIRRALAPFSKPRIAKRSTSVVRDRAFARHATPRSTARLLQLTWLKQLLFGSQSLLREKPDFAHQPRDWLALSEGEKK
jgi:hypothetical protein